MHKRENKFINNQKGMVSIIVTMIVMIVLSLIVLGFAQIARREQRQALDRQLNTQAFYAAESGINYARSAIASGIKANKNDCGPTPEYAADNNINSDTGVGYTCLLIKQDPEKLEYTIDAGNSKYVYMEFKDSAGNPTTVNYIIIWWTGTPSSNAVNTGVGSPWASHPLPNTDGWKDGGVGLNSLLRVTLTDLTSGFTREKLNNNSYTAYFYPSKNNLSFIDAKFNPAAQGEIVNGSCAGDAVSGYRCGTVIQGLAASKIFLRINPIYTGAKIEIEASNGATYIGSSTLKMIGAQAVVDVTGKANDVLKRVQVNIPLAGFTTSTGFEGPDYAVQSVTGICKLLSVAPNYGNTGVCP